MSRNLILNSICIILAVIALALPWHLVPRFRTKGVICGTIVTWLFLFLAMLGQVLNVEGDDPVGGLGMVMWFLGGWIVSFFYCMIILATRKKKAP